MKDWVKTWRFCGKPGYQQWLSLERYNRSLTLRWGNRGS